MDPTQPEAFIDGSGQILVAATPMMGPNGHLAYATPPGALYGRGRGTRAPYVRTTGFTPVTASSYHTPPTWAVPTEPRTGGPAHRLGESMFRLPQPPRAFQEKALGKAPPRLPQGGPQVRPPPVAMRHGE